jgi:hypothetical protein
MRAAALIALAIGVLAFTGSAAARPSAGPTTLPDCLGRPQVRPAEVILACGDGNASVSGLRWKGWGSSFAAATGVASINDCSPTCVAGHDHSYPVVLIVSGRETCSPGGQIAYRKVTLAFLDSKPHVSGSQTFPCKPFK